MVIGIEAKQEQLSLRQWNLYSVRKYSASSGAFSTQDVQSPSVLMHSHSPQGQSTGLPRHHHRNSVSLTLGDLCFKAKAQIQSSIIFSCLPLTPALSGLSHTGLILALLRLLVNQLNIRELKYYM